MDEGVKSSFAFPGVDEKSSFAFLGVEEGVKSYLLSLVWMKELNTLLLSLVWMRELKDILLSLVWMRELNLCFPWCRRGS